MNYRIYVAISYVTGSLYTEGEGAGYVGRHSDSLHIDGRGLIPCRGKRFFSSPQCPDRLWDHPTSYQEGNGCSFLRGNEAGTSS
jgi:hypothetical protein